MGTNFYTINGTHIGKRSAAGKYCWDCNVTFCKQGDSGVHDYHSEWYNACPICGKKYPELSMLSWAVSKELGFNKIKGKQTGVGTCCSFTWAVHPDKIKMILLFKDEYDRIYTKWQFKKEIDFCPIQFYDSIGKDFS